MLRSLRPLRRPLRPLGSQPQALEPLQTTPADGRLAQQLAQQLGQQLGRLGQQLGRRISPGLAPMLLGTAVLLGGGLIDQLAPLVAVSPALAGPELSLNPPSKTQASAAAERMLKTIQNGDANQRYQDFSEELRAITSPSMVAQTMATQPRLLRWSVRSIEVGLRYATVDVSLVTATGPRDLVLVINGQGQLAGYHYNVANQPSSKVIEAFIKALSGGHYISARSFLSVSLQEELTPQEIQRRWQGLQRSTGDFVAVKTIVETNTTPTSRLVLATTVFNRLTDTLFFTLNNTNQIIGIDFPTEPAPPQPIR